MFPVTINTRYRTEIDKLTKRPVPEHIVITNEFTPAEKKILDNPPGGDFQYVSRFVGHTYSCEIGEYIRPFLLAMDRYPRETDIMLEFRKGLQRHFAPPPPSRHGGGITPGMDRYATFWAVIQPYCDRVSLSKLANDERIKKEAEIAKKHHEKKLAEYDRGEYRKVGRRWYFVKEDGVYDIAELIDPMISYSARMKGCLPSCGDDPVLIRSLRGKKCFESLREAEEFWVLEDARREEATIEAEARRRIAEEECLANEAAKAVEREARVQAAMARLRSAVP